MHGDAVRAEGPDGGRRGACRIRRRQDPQSREEGEPQASAGGRAPHRPCGGARSRPRAHRRARDLRLRHERPGRRALRACRHRKDLSRLRACQGGMRLEDAHELHQVPRLRGGLEGCPGASGRGREGREGVCAFQVLVLDEWLLSRPDDGFRRFLLEIFELRYDERSTIFCTQYRQKDWHARLGADVTAEAIMDRIVHKTAWVDMGEMNMRAAIRTAASSSPRS